MASISETIQKIITAIASIFKRKPSLQNISKDELIKEKSTLERNERKILKQMETMEQQKIKLFEEAKREPSESVRRAKARQIRDIDQRINGLQATLSPLGKRISALGSLIAQREMGNFAPGTSEVMDALRQTDAQQIQQEIEEALAADLMQEEKLNGLAETFNAAQARDEALYDEGEELKNILAQIENAAAMDASVEEAALLKTQESASAESISHDKESPMQE